MPAVNRDLIKDRRDELDLSNRQLAALVQVSPAYLDNILCGADDPSGRVIHRFARALNLPAEEIKAAKPQGDPSEPPEQPENEPKGPAKRKERAGKAPKRVDDVRAAS